MNLDKVLKELTHPMFREGDVAEVNSIIDNEFLDKKKIRSIKKSGWNYKNWYAANQEKVKEKSLAKYYANHKENRIKARERARKKKAVL